MPSSLSSDAYVAFVDALAALRRDMGVTQAELAARIGRPQSFISKIERRERRIDVVEFIAVAEALNLAPGEALDRLRAALPADVAASVG